MKNMNFPSPYTFSRLTFKEFLRIFFIHFFEYSLSFLFKFLLQSSSEWSSRLTKPPGQDQRHKRQRLTQTLLIQESLQEAQPNELLICPQESQPSIQNQQPLHLHVVLILFLRYLSLGQHMSYIRSLSLDQYLIFSLLIKQVIGQRPYIGNMKYENVFNQK